MGTLLHRTILASLIASVVALAPFNPSSLANQTAVRSWEGGAGLAWAAPAADAASTLVVIDAPRGGNTGTDLEIRGWAADPTARGGTGVDRVEIYLDGERDAGGTRLGAAAYGLQRPDVAAHLGGQQFLLSGYALRATVAAGPHNIYVYAHPSDQPSDQSWAAPKQAAVMAVPGGGPPSTASGGGGGTVTLRLPGVTGSSTYVLPGAGSYYPPGPADTGGPVYGPVYYGLGLYGDLGPFLGSTAGYVPPGFDFSYGYGQNFVSTGYLTWPNYGLSYGPFGYPWYRHRYPPVYCPVYTAVVC